MSSGGFFFAKNAAGGSFGIGCAATAAIANVAAVGTIKAAFPFFGSFQVSSRQLTGGDFESFHERVALTRPPQNLILKNTRGQMASIRKLPLGC
jgi:hypothetical protein